MATQRYVSTSFWDDEWIQTLDPSEKLMYLYLMTNPLTTIAGVYKITKRRISFDTGFTLDTVGHILGKFEKACKVYNIGEYIILPSWPKHQKWQESVKVRSGIDRVLAQLPDEVLGLLVRINYEYDISGDLLRERGMDTPSNGHTYPTDTVPVHDGYPMDTPRTTLNSDSDFNSDLKPEHTASDDGSPAAGDGHGPMSNPSNPSKTSTIGSRFEAFWEAYPRKLDKGHARKAWDRIRPDEPLLGRMLDAISAQKGSDQWTREDGKFIPYPATWLNGHRWEDEVEAPRGDGRRPGAGEDQTAMGSKDVWDQYMGGGR